MFQDAASAPRFAPQSLAASLLIHAALITLVVSLRFPAAVPEFSHRALHATLLAPVPDRIFHPAAKSSAAKPSIAKSSTKTASRAFLPPPARSQSAPKPTPVLFSHPNIDIPRPVSLPLDLPPAPLPPSPIKTGTFAGIQPSAQKPQITRQAALKPSGFMAAENSALAPARGALATPIGSFDAAAAADTRTSHRNGGVKIAGFGDAEVVPHNLPAIHSTPAAPATIPVEILEKPRPAYTEEARRLSIEGEVLLELQFEASGRVRVLRLIRGLGHGLDENALAAARQIRFRPARRGGIPVDSSAIVHIVFQLAY